MNKIIIWNSPQIRRVWQKGQKWTLDGCLFAPFFLYYKGWLHATNRIWFTKVQKVHFEENANGPQKEPHAWSILERRKIYEYPNMDNNHYNKYFSLTRVWFDNLGYALQRQVSGWSWGKLYTWYGLLLAFREIFWGFSGEIFIASELLIYT